MGTREKEFVDHIVSSCPSALQASWWKKNFLLAEGAVTFLDSFTYSLKKFSNQIKVFRPSEPSQNPGPKRNLPTHTNPGPRGSAGGDSRPTSSKEPAEKRQRADSRSGKGDPVPANYACMKCNKMAGHWPMDCPELSGAEKLLTKDQWKLMAKQKQQERQMKYKNKPNSSYTDELQIFMARAQKDLDQ